MDVPRVMGGQLLVLTHMRQALRSISSSLEFQSVNICSLWQIPEFGTFTVNKKLIFFLYKILLINRVK